MQELGLYIHIPFCRQRCHFCAFYLEAGRGDRIDRFSVALTREIELYGRRDDVADRPLKSVYFGGGTPTALPVSTLTDILAHVRATWPVSPTAEITVEAHPSTVTADDLHRLVQGGFNRLSMGAESMAQQDFEPIGRPGTVQETRIAVAWARKAGFSNLGLDLMYGLPGQTVESWIDTLASTLALNPTHVSCYALTVEDGTALARQVTRQLVPGPDEALQVDMASEADALLTSAGFERYELSNYALPAQASRHNLLYWTNQDYLGLGPSAQSYVKGSRFGNHANLTAYIDHLGRGKLPIEERVDLSHSAQAREAVIFGLRLIRGVPRVTIEMSRSTAGLHAALAQLMAEGLLEEEADHIRLTSFGRRYADAVASRLY